VDVSRREGSLVVRGEGEPVFWPGIGTATGGWESDGTGRGMGLSIGRVDGFGEGLLSTGRPFGAFVGVPDIFEIGVCNGLIVRSRPGVALGISMGGEGINGAREVGLFVSSEAGGAVRWGVSNGERDGYGAGSGVTCEMGIRPGAAEDSDNGFGDAWRVGLDKGFSLGATKTAPGVGKEEKLPAAGELLGLAVFRGTTPLVGFGVGLISGLAVGLGEGTARPMTRHTSAAPVKNLRRVLPPRLKASYPNSPQGLTSDWRRSDFWFVRSNTNELERTSNMTPKGYEPGTRAKSMTCAGIQTPSIKCRPASFPAQGPE
jgi:hypothetical protein